MAAILKIGSNQTLMPTKFNSWIKWCHVITFWENAFQISKFCLIYLENLFLSVFQHFSAVKVDGPLFSLHPHKFHIKSNYIGHFLSHQKKSTIIEMAVHLNMNLDFLLGSSGITAFKAPKIQLKVDPPDAPCFIHIAQLLIDSNQLIYLVK